MRHGAQEGPTVEAGDGPVAPADALLTRLALLSRDAPDLDADVRSAQRARLVAMAAVRTPEPAPTLAQRVLARRAVDAPASPWRTRLTAGLAGASLTVAALGGVVALAQGAEPGDLLYDLKRGTEQTQLALASDSERGLTLLGFASTRLQELGELAAGEAGALPAAAPTADGPDVVLAAGGLDAATVTSVLDTMDDQTREGASALTTYALQAQDRASFGVLSDWADGQRSGLDALQPSVPEAAVTEVSESRQIVSQVAARATALLAALDCPGGPVTAGSDALGPVPSACVSATGPATSTTTAPVPGSVAPSTAAPAPGTAAPTAAPTSGGAASTGGGQGGGAGGTGGAASPAPTTAAPAPTSSAPTAGLPLPVPVPTAVPTSSGGALVELPPVGPIEACLPPLVTVGCR